MVYRIKDVHAKVSVIWNFQAIKGGGDTHFSIMWGTRSRLIIRQGKEQQYRPELYVELERAMDGPAVGEALPWKWQEENDCVCRYRMHDTGCKIKNRKPEKMIIGDL